MNLKIQVTKKFFTGIAFKLTFNESELLPHSLRLLSTFHNYSEGDNGKILPNRGFFKRLIDYIDEGR